jgi:hypothetical protein
MVVYDLLEESLAMVDLDLTSERRERLDGAF